MKKFALMYTEPADYTRACLEALRANHGCEILAITHANGKDAPFDTNPLRTVTHLHDRKAFRTAADIASRILNFEPDAVYISGWSDIGYLKAARFVRKKGIPIVSGLDAQYSGSLRQRVGIYISRFYLKNAIDILWVAGDRQAKFAEKLGYQGDRCWTGFYCCDWKSFDRARQEVSRNKDQFLFVGRYTEIKGIDLLLKAYKEYRKRVTKPWELVCAGTGPLKHLLAGCEGVQDLGFVQPKQLPQLMAESGAFVLPSRFEPWGVVVQEAAAAGLPLICSNKVGASVHLLQDYFNGFSFLSGNLNQLMERMVAISCMEKEELSRMGHSSAELSKQFSPARWAKTLVSEIAKFETRRSSNPTNNRTLSV